MISIRSVAHDLKKMQVIFDCPEPHSLVALRGLLVLIGFYRRFVRYYAIPIAPLTNLLFPIKFSRSTYASLAFTELKTNLAEILVFALRDFKQTCIVESETSGKTIRAIFS